MKKQQIYNLNKNNFFKEVYKSMKKYQKLNKKIPLLNNYQQ